MIVAAKPLDQMTLDELRTERAHWILIMQNAGTPAVLTAATRCWKACAGEIARRQQDALAQVLFELHTRDRRGPRPDAAPAHLQVDGFDGAFEVYLDAPAQETP